MVIKLTENDFYRFMFLYFHYFYLNYDPLIIIFNLRFFYLKSMAKKITLKYLTMQVLKILTFVSISILFTQ